MPKEIWLQTYFYFILLPWYLALKISNCYQIKIFIKDISISYLLNYLIILGSFDAYCFQWMISLPSTENIAFNILFWLTKPHIFRRWNFSIQILLNKQYVSKSNFIRNKWLVILNNSERNINIQKGKLIQLEIKLTIPSRI